MGRLGKGIDEKFNSRVWRWEEEFRLPNTCSNESEREHDGQPGSRRYYNTSKSSSSSSSSKTRGFERRKELIGIGDNCYCFRKVLIGT